MFHSDANPLVPLIAFAKNRAAILVAASVFSVLLCWFPVHSAAQEQRSLCRDGFGSFSSRFSTGVTVIVGAAKNGAFATHACAASLGWRKSVMHVAQGAYLVDIDVLGADLGFGVPAVTFQVMDAESDKVSSYLIYSLQKPPRLLRTISGASSYDAQDMNLEGRNEIWAEDAGSIDGFENLPLSSLDFLPTVALRFEKNRLIDVSSEFQPYFDDQIAAIRARLNAASVAQFKTTDGHLSSIQPQLLADLHALIRTKVAILEIVWAYLYSGREQKAWDVLAEMWPPLDITRIRTAILDARARGVLRQVEGTAEPGLQGQWKGKAVVYRTREKQAHVPAPSSLAAMAAAGMENSDAFEDRNAPPADVAPQAIDLSMPLTEENQHTLETSRMALDLVVDAAGKVRSAQIVNGADRGPTADALLKATSTWNFIPAFKAERPVACRLRIGISTEQ